MGLDPKDRKDFFQIRIMKAQMNNKTRKKPIHSKLNEIWTYLKDYRFNSILVKYFLLLFGGLAFPAIFVNLIYTNQIRESARYEIINRNDMAMQQAYERMDSILQSVKNLSWSLSQNKSVMYLATQNTLHGSASEKTDNVRDTLSSVLSANGYLDSIYVYFEKSDGIIQHTGINSTKNFTDFAWLTGLPRDTKNSYLFARKKYGTYPYLLSVCNEISDNRKNSFGTVVVNIDMESLGDYLGSGRYRNKDQTPSLFIMDEDFENIIYSDEYRLFTEESAMEDLKQICFDGDKKTTLCKLWGQMYVLSGFYSPREKMFFIYTSSLKEYESQSRQMTIRIHYVIFITFSICLILSILLTIRVFQPIQRTMNILESMYDMTDRGEKANEMEVIQRSLIGIKEEKKILNEQIEERMVRLHNAQICALQMQINPHFLFNTLESIGNAAVLLTGSENPVTNMLYCLGKLLRISLAGESYLVTIEEEMEHVRLYAQIMEFRYHGRIGIHIDIPEEVRREKIIKLTFQPLIENAIEHGLRSKRGHGDIWLKCTNEDDQIWIYVVDNGEGVSDKELQALNEMIRTSPLYSDKHIGLRNVHERLKLVFGEEFGLNISHAAEGGICVTVRFHCL